MVDILLLELDQYQAFLLFICVTVAYFCYQHLVDGDFDWMWVGLCLGFLIIVLVGLESDTIDLFRPDMIVEWYNEQPGKVSLRNYNTYLYPIGNSITDAWLKENGVTSNKKLFLSTSGLHQFTDYYQFYSIYPLRKDPLTPTIDKLYYFAVVIVNKVFDFANIYIYSYFWGYNKYEYIGFRPVNLYKYKYRVSGGDFFLWRDFVRFDYTGPFLPPYDRFGNKLPGTIHNTKYWIAWEPRKNSPWSKLMKLEEALTHDVYRERYFFETRGDLFPDRVYRRLRKHLKLPYTVHTRRADWVLPLSYDFYLKGFLGTGRGALAELSPRIASEVSWIYYLWDGLNKWINPFSFKASYYFRYKLFLNWAEGGLRDEFRDSFLALETGEAYAALFKENNRFKNYFVDYPRLLHRRPDWVRLSYQKVPIRRGFVDLWMKGWNQRWLKLKYIYVPEPLSLRFIFFRVGGKAMDGFFLPVKHYVGDLNKDLSFFGLFDLGYGSLKSAFLLRSTHSVYVTNLQRFDLFSLDQQYYRYYDDWLRNRSSKYLHIPIRRDFYDAGVFQLYPYLPKLGYVGHKVANLYPNNTYQPYATYPTRNYYLKKFFKLMTFNEEAKYYVKMARDFPEVIRSYMFGELGYETFYPEVMAGAVKVWVYVVIGYFLLKRVSGIFNHNQYDYDYLDLHYVKNPFTAFANFLMFLFATNFLLALATGAGMGSD